MHKDGLYILSYRSQALFASTICSSKASFETWDQCLGHVAFDVISHLKEIGYLVISSILLKPVLCTSCQLSKQQHLPFVLNNKRDLKVLDLVHYDFKGTCTDYFNRRLWFICHFYL